MSKAGGVEPLYGARYLDEHMEMPQPVALELGFDKAVAQFGRCKPFTLFLLAFEFATLEEKFALVGGYGDADFALPYHHMLGPCKEVAPIVASGASKIWRT